MLGLLLLVPLTVYADNQPTIKYNMIVIQYSPVCTTEIKYGLGSSCPPLSQLASFDTSNQRVSGIILQDHRTNPQAKYHWNFYQYSKPVVCVFCTYPGSLADAVRVITIEPHGFTWIDTNENSTNHSSVHSYSDVYIPDCVTAEIVFDKKTLNDTINYFVNNCQGVKPTGKTSTIQIKENPFEMNNPFSSLHQIASLKNIFQGHSLFGNNTKGGLGPGNLINYPSSYTDPYKKAGY